MAVVARGCWLDARDALDAAELSAAWWEASDSRDEGTPRRSARIYMFPFSWDIIEQRAAH